MTRSTNLYVDAVYRSRRPTPRHAGTPNLGPFFVDVFEYPPTFLPLPRLMAAATPDFWHFRRLWFALNLAGVVARPGRDRAPVRRGPAARTRCG